LLPMRAKPSAVLAYLGACRAVGDENGVEAIRPDTVRAAVLKA